MSDYNAQQPVSIEVSGTVIRCGCTDRQKNNMDWHGYSNEICPNPKKIEELGVMSYSHKNPFKVLKWKLSKLWTKLIKE